MPACSAAHLQCNATATPYRNRSAVDPGFVARQFRPRTAPSQRRFCLSLANERYSMVGEAKLPKKKQLQSQPEQGDRKCFSIRSHAARCLGGRCLVLASGSGSAGTEEIRPRRQRYRNQDRQHHALFGARLGLWDHRQDRRRLFQEDQRRGRHQRPQDQLHQLRRRLQPAEDRRADPQAGRERRSAAGVQPARHAAELGDPEVHERQEGAAAVRRHRRHQVERSQGLPLDHGLAAELPVRNAGSTPSTS